MADPHPETDTDTGMPRWVKVSGLIGILLVLVFVTVHLAGGGFRGHLHGGPTPPAPAAEPGVQPP